MTTIGPIARLRLNKEERLLAQEPQQNILVHTQKQLFYHFVFYNLKEPYEQGVYHGLLELHPSYPFAAPKLFFFTPNGRFQVNVAICASFTNYHQESWSSAWNLRSLLIATLSFMLSDEPSYGCIVTTDAQKKLFAKKSKASNLRNPIFKELFLEELKLKGIQFDVGVEDIQIENSDESSMNAGLPRLGQAELPVRQRVVNRGLVCKVAVIVLGLTFVIGLGIYLGYS